MLIIYTIASLVLGTVICILAGKRRPWLVQAAYAATVVASLLTAAKLSPLIEGVFVSVAIGLYSMSFLLTDYLGEIHGKRAALRAVYSGILAEVVVIFSVYFSIAVEPAPFWQDQEAFSTTFGAAPRIMVASITAFVVAQLLDVTVFDLLRKRMKGKWLGLRNNVSTFLGQTVDSVIFYSIAFAGVVPNLFELIVVTCLVKYAIAALDTPFLYLARFITEQRQEGGIADQSTI